MNAGFVEEKFVMLKITEVETANHSVTLKLEGRIVGPWVEELGRVCERLLNDGRGLELDASEISFVDHAGVVLLLELKKQDVSIRGCSPFVNEELKAVTDQR
jgi:ABC-type transporter Mla MlaB component